MKKILLVTGFMFFSFTVLFAQDTLDTKTFKKVINEQFSNIVTGQSKTTIGNFASLDLKETEVSFAGSAITDKGLVFGLKASGGVSDGLYSIFNNSTLNTNVALEGYLHFLTRKPQRLDWYIDSNNDYLSKKNEIIEKYRVKEIEAENSLEKINLSYKREKISKDLQKLKEELKKETTKVEKKTLRIDSLNYAIAIMTSNLKVTDHLIANYPKTEDVLENLANSRDKELKDVKQNIELDAFRFGWFSVYYKVFNNDFKRFLPSEPYSEQVTEISFVGHEVKTQYNLYSWSKESFKTYFLSLGVSFAVTDNFSDLSKKEIAEVKNYGPNPNDRTITKKYNAYVGDYEKNLKKVAIYGDYYHFLFANNIAAVHLYPEVNFRTSSKPIYNLGCGIMLALKDSKKDDKSIVNVEIYYNFMDILKNTETDLRLFERNDVGLRFTFPINFLNK